MAVQKDKDNDSKEEGESEEEAEEEEERHREELLGPSTEYVPQEEIVLESSMEVATFFFTKSILYFAQQRRQSARYLIMIMFVPLRRR